MPELVNPNLLWVDIETTGLDPRDHMLLEIAVVITDADLYELATAHYVVNQQIVLNDLSEWVIAQHSMSGLLGEVVRSPHTLGSVDRELTSLAWRSDLFPDPDALPPLCGSSIQFERQWLAAHLPEFYDRLHYRSIDVSSLKELMNRWWPEEAISRRATSKHRAMDDIRDSIAELAHYRALLWPSSPVKV